MKEKEDKQSRGKRAAPSPTSPADASARGGKRSKVEPRARSTAPRKAASARIRLRECGKITAKTEEVSNRLPSDGKRHATGTDSSAKQGLEDGLELHHGERQRSPAGNGKRKSEGTHVLSPKRANSTENKATRRPSACPPICGEGVGVKDGKKGSHKAKGGPKKSALALPFGNFRKALGKGPSAKQRKHFKLSKWMLPLGIWPSDGSEAFDLAPEWKASSLKRYENPPRYRKLKANLYTDSSLRGLVPSDEIPLCHCSAEDGCDADCINRLLLMECAPGRCPTLRGGGKHCKNNAIQTQAFPATEIFRTFEGRGWGLRLSDERGAEAGTLVHEYLGEVISMEECRKRLRKAGRSDFYFASLDGNLVLDAGPMGSEARFANHSCSPNCLMQKWSVLGETRVVLVAARDIAVGEELTYNYHADTLGGFVERQKCLCGEPQCSGFIGGELVAVKAEEWQKRASKVMNQAKPQLEVVRELFHEGQELGYELVDDDQDQDERGSRDVTAAPGATRYHGREMECLSIMLREGDDWLEQLAQVMAGRTTADTAADAARNNSATAAAEESAKGSPCAPPLRTSTRVGRGVHMRSDSDSSYEVEDGEETPPEAPRAIDLVQLEKVVRNAPTGLQILEAVNAKKTAARAGHVARTIWALLDAASKNGLQGINVPEERQPLPPLQGESSPAYGACSSVSSASSNGRGGMVGAGGGGGRGRGRGQLRGSRGQSGSTQDRRDGDDNAIMVCDNPPGAAPTGADAEGGEAMEVCDDGEFCADARSAETGGDRLLLVPVEETSGERWGSREGGAESATAFVGDVDTRTSRVTFTCAECSTGMVTDTGTGSSSSDGEKDVAAAAETAAAAAISRAENDSTRLEQGAFKPATAYLEVGVTTRSGGKRNPWASAAVVAEGKQVASPQPTASTSLPLKESESLYLPPKPKMSQVYQVIRSCRGLAPAIIPGASELKKLVAAAEAWAQEACDILKIKVSSDGNCDAASESTSATGGKGKDNDRDREVGKERGKWAKLGLKGSAMAALEEKLQEVAEFSLAREQRDEEVEKERVLREKEEVKERRRKARLEKLARLKSLVKRRNRPRGSSNTIGGVDHGDAVGGSRDNLAGVPLGGSAMSWEARRSPRIVSLGAGTPPKIGTAPAEGEGKGEEEKGNGDEETGWSKEDEERLHCLCRLPADTARFRTLMACDLCSSWFHPACVRLKELPARQRNKQPLAFICPMCEHHRGGVSTFAYPPSPGFYIGRRMHRPRLSELEALMEHADDLPVDGVDGQAYLSYMAEQVVGWRDRCHGVLKEVQAYIQSGKPSRLERSDNGTGRNSSTAAPAQAAADGEGEEEPAPNGDQVVEDGAEAVSVREEKVVEEATPPPSAGLVLASAGRDLAFEAALVERLGKLVCEGALIEVVDVHKEDITLRRALWVLTASLCFPSVAACLRAGQEPGLGETLSSEDEEALRSSGLSEDSTTRLRPTFETLEASLTEGRTLGLSRTRPKSRGSSASAASGQHAGPGEGADGVAANEEPPLSASGLSLPSAGSVSLASSCCSPTMSERPGSDPLGTGVRVYTCLFDAVGYIRQAVVRSEAYPFREARNFLPALRAATKWAAIEHSWGYARALASELSWNRGKGTSASCTTAGEAAASTVVGASAAATESPVSTPQNIKGADEEHGGYTQVYCICRRGDDGSVMVECDTCHEWYHAGCVGLSALTADRLHQYQCLGCCESHLETFGHYKHRWTTNVAIEAAVRRATPRRTSNLTKSPRKIDREEGVEKATRYGCFSGRWPSACSSGTVAGERSAGPSATTISVNGGTVEGGDAAGGHIVMGGGASHKRRKRVEPVCVTKGPEEVTPSSFAPKSLRDESSRQSERPGAKRDRAAAWIARYVERHYADLGILWPPDRPIPPRDAPTGNGFAQPKESAAPSGGRVSCSPVVEDTQVDVPRSDIGDDGKEGGVGDREEKRENKEKQPLHTVVHASFPSLGEVLVGAGMVGSGGSSGSGERAFGALPASPQGNRRDVFLHEHQHRQTQQQQQQQQPLAHQQGLGEEQTCYNTTWMPSLPPSAQELPTSAPQPHLHGSYPVKDAESPLYVPVGQASAAALGQGLWGQDARPSLQEERSRGEGEGPSNLVVIAAMASDSS